MSQVSIRPDMTLDVARMQNSNNQPIFLHPPPTPDRPVWAGRASYRLPIKLYSTSVQVQLSSAKPPTWSQRTCALGVSYLSLRVQLNSPLVCKHLAGADCRLWTRPVSKKNTSLPLIIKPDGRTEWVVHLSPILGDRKIQTLVESNQWCGNWYLLLPSQALGIIRIGQG